jgi:hypothetical protein
VIRSVELQLRLGIQLQGGHQRAGWRRRSIHGKLIVCSIPKPTIVTQVSTSPRNPRHLQIQTPLPIPPQTLVPTAKLQCPSLEILRTA